MSKSIGQGLKYHSYLDMYEAKLTHLFLPQCIIQKWLKSLPLPTKTMRIVVFIIEKEVGKEWHSGDTGSMIGYRYRINYRI